MCGLAGFFDLSGKSNLDWPGTLTAMGAAIAHRGPDDDGIWFDANAGIGLAHRRLAVVDLSSAGHQPMVSPTGRFVLVFNGEIYNHLEVRTQLEAQRRLAPWRGHSDTETLLAAIEAWGLDATLRACVGMFALALWDREEQALLLARDRLGEKPLYYGRHGDQVLFGSELKALQAHPAFSRTVDRNALALLLRHDYIPAPYSVFEHVRKLPAGTWIKLQRTNPDAQPQAYWSMRDVVANGLRQPMEGDVPQLVQTLDQQLRESIRMQMLADVPLGAFLSGGVDSSTVVALMQAQTSRRVKTFTIGFEEADFDEAPHARAVAQHLGTDHSELYVTGRQALDLVPSLPTLFDEPFADSSQLPTHLLAKLTRQHVTVALSGDGGDEIFGGYGRYFLARSLWRKTGRLPNVLRRSVVAGLHALPSAAWDAAARPITGLLAPRHRSIGDRVHKLADVLRHDRPQQLYRHLVSHWRNPADVVIGAHEPATALTSSEAWPPTQSFEQWMMFVDTVSYLPDDILVKVDRAAMGVALETRVPLLDHRIVELAWRLPQQMKMRGREGKWLLRQVLFQYVPRALVERPKMGFGIPLGPWLRGPLRAWAEELLDASRLRREGYFHVEPIRQKWAEHLSGQRNWHPALWNVLMFQAWLDHQASR